jgi:hypothetical protein
VTPSKPRPDGAKRPYHRHGNGVVTKALPYLLERVADERLRDEELTPLEVAARAWRHEAEKDLGGNLAATKRALLDAATGTVILLTSLDRYVFMLAAQDGLVNKRSRRAFPVLDARMRLADSLTKQLGALGLERRMKPAPDLAAYIRERYGSQEAGQTLQEGERQCANGHEDPSAEHPGAPAPSARV